MTTVTFSTSSPIAAVSCGHCQPAATEAPVPLPGNVTVAADDVSGTARVESKHLLHLLDPDFEVAL